jgi:DNA-binding response OmpR family regulator
VDETRPIRVLLLEDNPGDSRLLELTLAEAGRETFELEMSDRLSTGLSRLAQGDIQVVLLDLSLPDSHGLDTFSAVQAAAPEVPIVVLSGADDRELAVTAVRLGAQDYLVKGTFVGDSLVRAIRYAMERHSAEQRIRQRVAELSAEPEARSVREEPLRVFLCHSSVDKPRARALYDSLAKAGIDAWLDEEKLLPGQDWRLEILKAVRSSHAVVVCLSEEAVDRAGYVHKEIRQALDVADEQPEGAMFIVPLRFEECAVPERLKQWQWVDFFSKDGFEQLMRSLQARAEHLGIAIPAQSSGGE